MSKKSRRKPTSDPPQEELELADAPTSTGKFRIKLAFLLDKAEVAALLEASSAPVVDVESERSGSSYDTYDEYEALSLINGTYLSTKKSRHKR